MNFLPKEIEDIIIDYKTSVEEFDIMSKNEITRNEINFLLNTLKEMSIKNPHLEIEVQEKQNNIFNELLIYHYDNNWEHFRILQGDPVSDFFSTTLYSWPKEKQYTFFNSVTFYYKDGLLFFDIKRSEIMKLFLNVIGTIIDSFFSPLILYRKLTNDFNYIKQLEDKYTYRNSFFL